MAVYKTLKKKFNTYIHTLGLSSSFKDKKDNAKSVVSVSTAKT